MRLGQISFITFTSKIISSVIGFLTTIYLARELGAEVLGSYFLIIALVIWLQIIGSLGIRSAVTKRISEIDTDDSYIIAGFLLILAIFLFLSILIIVFREYISIYLGFELVEVVILLFFSGILLKYISSVLKGQHLVHIASILNPIDRTLRSIIQIAAVVLGFGLLGLLVGYIVGAIIAGLLGILYISFSIKKPKKRDFQRILSYAKYSWLGSFESRTFSSMDTLILGIFVSTNLIGFYEIAWNLASFLAIFGASISQVIFPEISKMESVDNGGQISQLVDDAISYTGLFLIPGFIGSIVVGDWVLSIYGSEFQRAYYILLILIIARIIYAYGNQFMNAINGVDRPDIAFRINGIFVASNLVLNIVLVYFYGWIGAAIATTIGASITLIFGYRNLSKLINLNITLTEIAKQWIASIIMGLILYVLRLQIDLRLLNTILLVSIGAIIYFSILILISGKFRATITKNISIR